MKYKIGLLFIICCLLPGGGIAQAVEIQTAPIEQKDTTSSETNKQHRNIGPRDPEKDKPMGVWVDFYLEKNMAVGCGLSLNSYDSSLQNGQSGNSGKLGLGDKQVEGCVGLKFLFK
jgi:hypothetical protein